MSTLSRGPSVADVVSLATVHAMIEYVVGKKYDAGFGVLGIRGRLADGDRLTSEHGGRPVEVVYACSALAAREAVLDWRPDRWLVLITDRSEDDLGSGVLAHLIGQQLRSPDPWQAVRQRFAATAVDARLTLAGRQRGIAQGLLETMPAQGWPPAPAGVLTRDHALGAVARSVLELTTAPLDLVAVLEWTMRAAATGRLAELREIGGDDLAETVIDWIAAATGDAAPAVGRLLGEARPADLVPLGLVISFLRAEPTQRHEAELAIARLAHRMSGPGGRTLEPELAAIGLQAETVTAALLADARTSADAERAIAVADALILQAGADGLAERSDLLRTGLVRRLHRLADALRAPVADADAVERAWRAVNDHVLARVDPRLPVFLASVRLARWLRVEHGEPAPGGRSLAALARRQAEIDGWVDAAVNDAAAGVDDPELGGAVESLLAKVREVRDGHDAEFAEALAAGTRDETGTNQGFLEHDGGRVFLLERLLPEVVVPLARRERVLLLVLDGLSTGVATEIFADLLDNPANGWAERLADGTDRRSAGLAVLPSVTDVSRTSLLSGRLLAGQQDRESRGYTELTSAHGLGSSPLFHKRDLDTARLGYSLADPVRHAIDDHGVRLVSAVLNTIDDALDRSDPAGTHWRVDAVKHLQPLLDRAREAGRTVVITADHGHVVERRLGQQRAHPGGGATRHREPEPPVHPDEVLVEGPRVLAPGNRAVLAVSERLRYGPLKAGYHGGAAPAEVVVPVLIMVPVEQAQDEAVRLAPSQQPPWWDEPAGAPVPPTQPRTQPPRRPTLFDEDESPGVSGDAGAGAAGGAVAGGGGWGERLVGSRAYAAQRRVAGRVAIGNAQVARLLDELLAAPHHRLGSGRCARALAVAPARLGGAIEQVRKLLNVEGYPVIAREPATGAVILDAELAAEQFGVSP